MGKVKIVQMVERNTVKMFPRATYLQRNTCAVSASVTLKILHQVNVFYVLCFILSVDFLMLMVHAICEGRIHT